MSEATSVAEILNLIAAPAFSVCEGVITNCNDGAERLFFKIGTPIADLMLQDHSQYLNFTNGCLYIRLKHGQQSYSASVVRTENTDIFVVDEKTEQIELKTLSLTAANMRQPLSSMIATASNLSAALEQTVDPKIRSQLQHMNRNLYRMHRMLCNMSDTLQYAEGSSSNMLCQNVVSVVENIFQQSQQLCVESGFHFEYSVPNESILSSIDEDLLERAIFNMISNAIKFSDSGSVIQASLFHQDKRLYISIQDQGCGIPSSIVRNVFQRYQRQPSLEDARSGLGLGLALVRCAARVHQGTVLIDHPGNIGTRVTISFPISNSSIAMVRSNITRTDYAGGWDHGLLELSDVMPPELYS
jgi:K+-sensing histidine kinase KdpD